MVARAIAQAAAGRDHARIRQQHADAVVIARHAHGGQHGKGFGLRVPELRGQDGVVVGERGDHRLPADHHHLPVGQDHAVGKRACIGHRRQRASLRCAAGGVDQRGVAFGDGAVVVVHATAERQHFAGVKHHGVPAHAVGVVGAQASVGGAAGSAGVDPVHLAARAGVQNLAVAHGDQPHVVVRAVVAARVGCQEAGVRSAHAAQGAPADAGCEHLAGLGAHAAFPRATHGQHRAIRQRHAGVVGAWACHVGHARPGVVGRVVDAGHGSIEPAIDEQPAIGEAGRAGAEHVVLGFGDGVIGSRVVGRIKQRRVGAATAAEAGGHVSRPEQHLARIEHRARGRHEREADRGRPFSECRLHGCHCQRMRTRGTGRRLTCRVFATTA